MTASLHNACSVRSLSFDLCQAVEVAAGNNDYGAMGRLCDCEINQSGRSTSTHLHALTPAHAVAMSEGEWEKICGSEMSMPKPR